MRTALLFYILFLLSAGQSSLAQNIEVISVTQETGYPAYLDDPSNVGKTVDVAFWIDEYGTKLTTPVITRQRITSLSEMDDSTKVLLRDFKEASGSGRTFIESAAWQVYTPRGYYRSEIGTGDNTSISNSTSIKLLVALFTKIRNVEGQVKIVDIEFYHTHLDPGEAFNVNDADSHYSFLNSISAMLQREGSSLNKENFVSYAVPVNGQVFFRYRTP